MKNNVIDEILNDQLIDRRLIMPIPSEECLLVQVRAKWRRTQKLQLGTNQLQLLL